MALKIMMYFCACTKDYVSQIIGITSFSPTFLGNPIGKKKGIAYYKKQIHRLLWVVWPFLQY